MHISELEVRLSSRDLQEMVKGMMPAGGAGGVEEVQIEGDQLRAQVRVDGLPTVPIRARVARVEPQELVLDLDLGGVPLPEWMLEKALDFFGNRVGVPGMRMAEGQLHLAMTPLLEKMPARFTLAGARIEDDVLHLGLRDLEVNLPAAALTGLAVATGLGKGVGKGIGNNGRPAEPVPEAGAPEMAGPPGLATAGRDGDQEADREGDREGDRAGAPTAGDGPEDLAGPLPIPISDAAAGFTAGDRTFPPERALPPEHEGTYRTLRSRIQHYLDRSLPAWLQPAVPWLLLLPDFMVLLARLGRDERVSPRAKLLAGAVLAYIALPLDVMPDVLPLVGILDDLALVILALEGLVAMTPRAVVQEHWPGKDDILNLVREGLDWTSRYFPRGLMRRLRDWLHREKTVH